MLAINCHPCSQCPPRALLRSALTWRQASERVGQSGVLRMSECGGCGKSVEGRRCRRIECVVMAERVEASRTLPAVLFPSLLAAPKAAAACTCPCQACSAFLSPVRTRRVLRNSRSLILRDWLFPDSMLWQVIDSCCARSVYGSSLDFRHYGVPTASLRSIPKERLPSTLESDAYRQDPLERQRSCYA